MSGFEMIDGNSSGFESHNCIDLWIDGLGDTTVRPCRPELLPFLMAERDKIAYWQKLLDQPEPSKKPDAQDLDKISPSEG